jgi:predicted glycoside hydrolase/deacetylase ChbG (UPF0249 family)
MTTGVTLCADDHGISPAVSAAIAELAWGRRVTAVSCMTHAPDWRAAAADLRGAPVALGVHLTVPGATYASLARDLLTGRLRDARRLDAIADAWRAQVDTFEDAFGRSPDHLDSHQHVHQLPGLRDSFLDLARARGEPVLRTTWEPPRRILARGVAVPKALALAAAGLPLRRAIDAAGLRRPTGFSGVYDFSPGDFASRFRAFLRGAPPGALLMLHPGRVDDALRAVDPVTTAREVERAFLASAALEEALS